MDESELMALPEITGLNYSICEVKHEDGPHILWVSGYLADFKIEQTPEPIFEYSVQVDGIFSDELSAILSRNSPLSDADEEREYLFSTDYGPYLEKTFDDFWILVVPGKVGQWEERFKVARINSEVIQKILLKLEEVRLKSKLAPDD